jgi:long-chain fatty acid transport protein
MKTGQQYLRMGVAAGTLCAAFGVATDANAGAFALREQSTTFQGMSYAGSAAGVELSSMFWNSAAAAAVPGFNVESHAALVIPDSSIEATGGAFVTLGGLGTDSGDLGDPAVVPASYVNYQLSEQLFLGLATNSPFGFTTKPDNTDWAGSPNAITSSIFSVNLNPTLAYKIDPQWTVGVGVQVQYTKVGLRRGEFNPGVVVSAKREFDGDDIGFGATAGVLFQPSASTSIGLGYRSPISLDIEGDYDREAFAIPDEMGGFTPVPGVDRKGTASVTLPELVTLSARQDITDRLTVLGTIEWTNWSRLSEVSVKSGGETLETLAFNYEDGWFYSVGLEYEYSPALTLRTGLAFEESPITDETRNVLLPDNDRIWLSVGATYQYSEKLAFDVAYTHIFVDDGKICREGPDDCSGGDPTLTADTEASVDIISASVKYKVGGGRAPLEPLK